MRYHRFASLMGGLYFIFFSTPPLYAACTPSGTSGDDTVVCTGNITSFQYFYGGSDSVTLTGVSARTYSNSYWLDEALGGNPATDGNDTFISHNSQFYWVLGFGGDDSFTITNSEFNNAYGDTNPGHGTSQRGNDTFLIENSTSYGYILGGNDNDTITIIDSNVSNVASGYSNIYGGTDYSPYDGNDTILLDRVNFTAPLYWDATQIEGIVEGGRGNDQITFQHGGEAYYVYGGHGNDTIEVFDNEQFHACVTSSQTTDRCGIYGDEAYTSELNASAVPILHGDDRIILHDGNISGILIQGGDGSDLVRIETPVLLVGTELDGGDDISAADTFIDRIELIQWTGDLNGSQFHNWEQVRLHNDSNVTFQDANISVGADPGLDPSAGLPYGLIIDDGSTLNLYHDFVVDGNLHNNAILNLQDNDPSGMLLEITGDYTASSGKIYLDTVLNGNSPGTSDVVHIHGNATGETQLFIQNIGGTGAQTVGKGILLVEIDGDSDAQFTLDSEPLIAGDYLYALYKADDGNWYLHSVRGTTALQVTKESDTEKITITYNENGHIIEYSPANIHYTIHIKNIGNTSLSQIEITDRLDNTTELPVSYISGDTNHNEVLDPQENWIYTTQYTLSEQSFVNNTAFGNEVIVQTETFNHHTISETSINTISIDTQTIIHPTPTPTPTPTPVPTPTPSPLPTHTPESTPVKQIEKENNCSCSEIKSDSAGFNGEYIMFFILLLLGTGSTTLKKSKSPFKCNQGSGHSDIE